MTDCSIEIAPEAVLAACFAMLPSLATPDTLVLAARGPDGALAGAGGVVWRSWRKPAGMPAWLSVFPDRRGRGVGRALLTAMAAAAGEEGASLVSFETIATGEAAACFAEACGATADHRHFFFEADAREFGRAIAPLAARMRSRIPAGARIGPLDEADAAEVKWLVAAEMATPPPQVEAMLNAAADAAVEASPVDYRRSRVLTVDGTVAGALLSRRLADRDADAIVCNVVAPAWRGGWANAMLLDAFTGSMIADGRYRIAFDCGEEVRDTIGLARRSKADLIETRVRYRYAAIGAPA